MERPDRGFTQRGDYFCHGANRVEYSARREGVPSVSDVLDADTNTSAVRGAALDSLASIFIELDNVRTRLEAWIYRWGSVQ